MYEDAKENSVVGYSITCYHLYISINKGSILYRAIKVRLSKGGFYGMNNSDIITLIVAFVTALSSLCIAGISFLSTRKNTRDLETLKADLADKQAENDARRDYLYEARKRLYHEYEPLLFQLIELSESALTRIYGLARTAKQGNLGPTNPGWLSPKIFSSDYYITTTIYKLLAPLVIIKLIQKRLTFVDLNVDAGINHQYFMAKMIYMLFSEDFALARTEPHLEYDPDNKEWRKMRESHPEKYWQQGIRAALLDNAIEALIIRESKGISRCMSFGEFTDRYMDPDLQMRFETVKDVFLNFHPKTRPVLWRILITQAHLYEALQRTREISNKPQEQLETKIIIPFSKENRGKLDWRQTNDEATDEEVLNQPFQAALTYLQRSLGKHFSI
jgi:hypothetical protein